jgi:hypothetical protein
MYLMLDDLTRPLRGGTWEGEDGYVQSSYSYELVINYLCETHSIRLVEEISD